MSPRGFRHFTGALQFTVLLVVLLSSAPLAQAQVDGTARAPAAGRTSTSQLPTLGDGSELGASAERRLGDRIAREIYRDSDYLNDPVLVENVDAIWQPLLAAARSRGDVAPELVEQFAWEIMLGRDLTINPFALPGGYLGLHLGLHLGLIGVVASRDELASLLAHELSHVTQRQISRLMSKQNAQAPRVIGAMILGALAASKSPESACALMADGQAVAMQNQLNFSRDMEREADGIGFSGLSQAGFPSQGFTTMFDKLQQAARLNDNGAFSYLRSHPLTTERIADALPRQPSGPANPLLADVALDHAMVSARARILPNPGVDALRHAVAESAATGFFLVPASGRAAALYGAALAAVKLRDFGAAQASLAQLSELTRALPAAARPTLLLAAELSLQAGQAGAILSGAVRPEPFLNTQNQVRAGRAGEAIPDLQIWLAQHPRDASAWQLLAGACAAQGLSLWAIRAETEAQVAQMDYAAALDLFKATQTLMRNGQSASIDHIEASIIDTRARAVQLLLRAAEASP